MPNKHMYIIVAKVLTIGVILILSFMAIIVLVSIGIFPGTNSNNQTGQQTTVPQNTTKVGAFLTINGTAFSYKGKQVYLRGENFNNAEAMEFGNPQGIFPSNILSINVNESDYTQLAGYGANHVRFGLAYSWYAKNRTQFFQMLDQHIAWAKKHHLWLILVLFTLPNDCWEGYSATCAAYWNPSTGQQTLVKNFWVDIATRYRNETTIAGYDVLNEPSPTATSAWYGVAQTLHDAILQADPNHFVVIELPEAPNSGNITSFVKTFGPKTVYSEHDYRPDSFTQFLFPSSITITGRTNPYKYPGPAPDWAAVLHYWSKSAYNGTTNDSYTSMKSYLFLEWFKTNNVPLWIGEVATAANFAGYNQLIQDKLSLYNSYGVHWALFGWKLGPGNYTSAYAPANFQDPSLGAYVSSDKLTQNAILPEWQGSVQP